MESTATQTMWGKSYGLEDESNVGGLVVGMDFGSSNSSVAIWRADKNRVKIIRNKSTAAAKVTPSLIQFEEKFNGYKIGNDCDESADNTITGLKALLMSSPDQQNEKASAWLDAVTVTCHDRPLGSEVSRQSKNLPVEELVGHIISYLKDCAEEYLTRKPIKKVNVIDGTAVESGVEGGGGVGGEINRVVMGIPASFTEHSKRCLKNAAQLAGFQEVHFMVESTAAAAAYGLAVAGHKTVLVVDMGGGTTDLSVVSIADGTFTVRATGGNNALGGKNIDAALLELVLNKAKALPEDQLRVFQETSRSALLKLCRQCKEALTTEERVVISIPHPSTTTPATAPATSAASAAPPQAAAVTVVTIDVEVTRLEFEQCISAVTDLVQATVRHTVQQYLIASQQPPSAGVVSPSPSPSPPVPMPTLPVLVEGKAVDLHLCEEEEKGGFVTVTKEASNPHALSAVKPTCADLTVAAEDKTATAAVGGEEVIQEVVLVGGSSRVPAVRAAIRRAFGDLGIHRFSPTGDGELCTSLNPEEVVAEGLAIRGAVLSGVSAGKLRDLLVMDCLANAVGVLSWEHPLQQEKSDHSSTSSTTTTAAGVRVFDAVLLKGAPLPAENKMRFTLADAAQRCVSLDIYEETEEMRIKPTSAASGDDISPTLRGGEIFETHYAYHVMATVDVPIPPLSAEDKAAAAKSGTTSAVDVTFTMTSEGVLKFDVCRVYDTPTQHPHSASAEGKKASEFSSALLVLYGVLMLALYLFVKVTLTPDPSTSATTVAALHGVEVEL